MFLGRIGNALSLLSAGPGEGGCQELLVQGDSDKAAWLSARGCGKEDQALTGAGHPGAGQGRGQGRAAWQDHPVAFVPGLLSSPPRRVEGTCVCSKMCSPPAGPLPVFSPVAAGGDFI